MVLGVSRLLDGRYVTGIFFAVVGVWLLLEAAKVIEVAKLAQASPSTYLHVVTLVCALATCFLLLLATLRLAGVLERVPLWFVPVAFVGSIFGLRTIVGLLKARRTLRSPESDG
jgi:hypothetical protein